MKNELRRLVVPTCPIHKVAMIEEIRGTDLPRYHYFCPICTATRQPKTRRSSGIDRQTW
jgi:hypothetical protein